MAPRRSPVVAGKSSGLWVGIILRLRMILVMPFQAESGRAKKFEDAMVTAENGRAAHKVYSPRSPRSPRRPPWYPPRQPQHSRTWHRRPLFIAVSCILAAMILFAVYYFVPLWASAAAIPVNGTTDHYTIVILSYGPRLNMLRGAIRHYSRCPSAQSVVVVWNAGTPPSPAYLAAFSSIPVRIRIEATNSLNNRFKPDPEIATRAVFSIDDDIRIPCSDVESAFAGWRRGVESMVGFFPRLIESFDGSEVPEFRGEVHAVRSGKYNVVLTGAAFLDADVAFRLYWADELASARAVVDEVFNGEDLLMNFVLANDSLASNEPAVRFHRPKRRLDISKLSSVGISHAMGAFQSATVRYLRAFTATFDGSPLRTRPFEWTLGVGTGPLFCEVTSIGCMYL